MEINIHSKNSKKYIRENCKNKMTDFNWSRYAQWENQQEWDFEPHEEQCICSKCVKIDKKEMMRLEAYEAQRDDGRC